MDLQIRTLKITRFLFGTGHLTLLPASPYALPTGINFYL